MKEPKFKIGDTVEIIEYGSLAWIPKSEFNEFRVIQEMDTYFVVDISPDEVGKRGVIWEITTSQGRIRYALLKLGKEAWFNEEQLKKVGDGQVNITIYE